MTSKWQCLPLSLASDFHSLESVVAFFSWADALYNDYHYKGCNLPLLARVRSSPTPMHCCWECAGVPPLWKTIWQFLIQLNTGEFASQT